ncbi:Drug/Metabolite Transporter (DMT) Superfamily [Phytophthora palmivora]|uniref:Drug/Metabolite Transporter (DMT) Superfamily n=1 Tax=Phytophthora palmivora TaxID=4796 RepID=A0A2P4WXD7_9STRA|nr:Drug/Metabolite Transporter (DMT) Superfamily [Phytophthora palmivora]POM62446.1 Drug/Metabolite Transporter (DMT) Superfamily [Phytophthora palmivora]
MLMSYGVSIAVINSVVNALCDPLRKYLTKFMDPFMVVALRGLIQAPLFVTWAIVDTGGRLPPLNHLFWTSVCISGCINIITSYLYNRAIQISTLSATVPFLSFTPAFLVIVAFLVLGEVPTVSGVLGVSIATLGGFWLQGAKDEHASKDLLIDSSNASKGSMYTILVAFLWSISNVFDKIGVQNSTPLVYGATIQVIVAGGSYILQKMRVGGEEIYLPIGEKMKIPWKFVILAGVTSVVAYYINLVATQHLEVSYVIAIKRSGCIWSVLMGRFLFRERNLRKKIPSILLMVLGVICIVMGKE